jgi:hypothetical protein
MEFMTIIQHEEYAKRMDDEHKRQNRRIDLLEQNQQQINDLTVAVKEIAMSTNAMMQEQKEQGERLEALEERDGEMWRKVSSHAIMVVIGAVIAFMFTQSGM